MHLHSAAGSAATHPVMSHSYSMKRFPMGEGDRQRQKAEEGGGAQGDDLISHTGARFQHPSPQRLFLGPPSSLLLPSTSAIMASDSVPTFKLVLGAFGSRSPLWRALTDPLNIFVPARDRS